MLQLTVSCRVLETIKLKVNEFHRVFLHCVLDPQFEICVLTNSVMNLFGKTHEDC